MGVAVRQGPAFGASGAVALVKPPQVGSEAICSQAYEVGLYWILPPDLGNHIRSCLKIDSG